MAREKSAELLLSEDDERLVLDAMPSLYGINTNKYPVVMIPPSCMSSGTAVACLLCDYYRSHINVTDGVHRKMDAISDNMIYVLESRNYYTAGEIKDSLTATALKAQDVWILKNERVTVMRPSNSFADTVFAVFWMLPWIIQKLFELKHPVFSASEVTDLQRVLSNTKTLQEKVKLGMAFLKANHYFDEIVEREKQVRLTKYKEVAKLVVTDDRERMLKALEESRELQQRELGRLNESIRKAMQQLRSIERNIRGWYDGANDAEDEKVNDLADFLNRMSEVIEVEDRIDGVGAYRIYVHTYLEDIDQEALTKCCEKENTDWGVFYRTEIGKWFVDDVLRSEQWKIRVRDSWRLSPDGVYLNGRADVDTPTETINFHISKFQCVSGYVGTLAQYNEMNDVIGALYTAIKATKGFNVLDSTVSHSWIESIKKDCISIGRQCRCLYNTKTGEIQSYAERYREWKNEHKGETMAMEGETNERVDIGF